MTTIALVHATKNSLAPAWAALQELAPDWETLNFMDEGLLPLVEQEGLSPRVHRRLARLLEMAEGSAAEAVLLTCTVASPLVEVLQPQFRLPLISPDSAMLESAALHGGRIGLVATVAPTLDTAEFELRKFAARLGTQVEPVRCHVPGAFTALGAGDRATHDQAVAEAACHLSDRVDTLVLCQFSMAAAASHPRVQALSTPVLTSPRAAVEKIRRIL